MIDRRLFLQKLLSSSFLLTHYHSFAQTSLPDNINQEIDWAYIRTLFSLSHDRAYLNNGTIGPSPTAIMELVFDMMREVDKAGDYHPKENLRETIATFIGAEKEEIALTHNTTEGINIMCWGLKLRAKDEVIVTNQEHVGNALPWLNRAKIDNLRLKHFEVAPTAEETFENLKKQVTHRTKVIAIPHITCTNGQVLPIAEICAWAKQHNIYTCIDGAHAPGMIQLDMKALGCDFYASCGHKWLLGPKGTGFLYVNKKHLENNQLRPLFVGAFSDIGWEINVPQPYLKGYNPTAQRYDYGTQNYALWAGLEAAILFLAKIGMNNVEERTRNLAKYFQTKLADLQLPNLNILTPFEEKSRAAIVTFSIDNLSANDINKILLGNCFRVRIVQEHKMEAIRVSTHIYNQYQELDNLLKVIAQNFGK